METHFEKYDEAKKNAMACQYSPLFVIKIESMRELLFCAFQNLSICVLQVGRISLLWYAERRNMFW